MNLVIWIVPVQGHDKQLIAMVLVVQLASLEPEVMHSTSEI
jgi:hypothetical protein